MKKTESIIHVELATGQHYYFGSLTAIYDHLTAEEVGVKLDTLYRHSLSTSRIFSNKKCTIRKSVVHRKDTNRKPYVKIVTVKG